MDSTQALECAALFYSSIFKASTFTAVELSEPNSMRRQPCMPMARLCRTGRAHGRVVHEAHGLSASTDSAALVERVPPEARHVRSGVRCDRTCAGAVPRAVVQCDANHAHQGELPYGATHCCAARLGHCRSVQLLRKEQSAVLAHSASRTYNMQHTTEETALWSQCHTARRCTAVCSSS